MDDYESVLCVKNEVFVYRIPARTTNRGYRAADWKLDEPDWTGRLKVTSKSKKCMIKLEDKLSGELFAESPIDVYPGAALEQVLDSSRYFVIRIQDPTGRHAFIGIGFADRGDSFDLIVALQDHFKHLKREENAAQAEQSLSQGPKLDLGFKEGQTIKININTRKGDDEETKKSRPRGAGGLGGGILPPPPGGVKIAPPRPGPAPPTASFRAVPSGAAGSHVPQPIISSSTQSSSVSSSGGSSNLDLLLDFGVSSQPASHPVPTNNTTDPWGDFTSANGNNKPAAQSWVNFD